MEQVAEGVMVVMVLMVVMVEVVEMVAQIDRHGAATHQREVEEGDERPEGEADDDALGVVVHQLHRDRREPCATEREPPRSEDCARRELRASDMCAE